MSIQRSCLVNEHVDEYVGRITLTVSARLSSERRYEGQRLLTSTATFVAQVAKSRRSWTDIEIGRLGPVLRRRNDNGSRRFGNVPST
jgi:hypothetical protein